MVLIQKLYIFLFFIGIFFIPFNSYKGIPFLGEFSRESAFLFFSSGLLFFALDAAFKNKIILPLKNKIFILFVVFLGYCFLATLFNLFTVYNNYFKQTSGINRFFNQYLVLIVLSLFFLLYFYKVTLHFTLSNIFLKIRRVFSITFVLMGIYSFIEILIVVAGKHEFESMIRLFDYFPFTEVKLDKKFGRISSVSFEPPFLAIYLITIAGWMFSYIITHKGVKKFVPALVVLVMTFFSGSRTALVVILVQFVFFLFLLLDTKEFRKYFVYLIGVVFAGVLGVVIVTKGEVFTLVREKIETLNFSENLTQSVSNKSRFGMQYANFMVFKNNPLFGVGFGQQAYHNNKYYPEWATKNNYEFTLWYLNEERSDFPPGYNLYIRILAETGILGFLLFLTINILIILKLFKFIKKENKEIKIFSIVLLVSFLGFLLNWLQIDTFRIFGFWICVALVIRIQYSVKKKMFFK